MVAVLVPAQTDSIVDPLDALEVRRFTWPPDDFEPARISRERLLKKHLDVDVDDNSRWFDRGRFVPDIRRPRDVPQSPLESTKPLSSGVSTAACEKEDHPELAFLGLAVWGVS